MSHDGPVPVDLFDTDGSLRDLVFRPAGPQHWDRVMRFAASAGAGFTQDGHPRELPATAEDAFDLARASHAMMRLPLGGVMLHCHFTQRGEIEFDLDPREVRDAGAATAVLEGIRQLAVYLGCDALLTGEGAPDDVLLRYDLASDRFSAGS